MQGCRESFAPEGVVVVNVLKSDEKYDSISNLRIVPSNVNELIYYPTDWSLVIDNNHDVDKLITIVSFLHVVSLILKNSFYFLLA